MNKLLRKLKKRLNDDNLNPKVRLEIVTLLKEMQEWKWLESVSSINKMQKELRRLANG